MCRIKPLTEVKMGVCLTGEKRGLQELKVVPISLRGLCGVVGGSPRSWEEWLFQPSQEVGRMLKSIWPPLEAEL